MQSKDCKFSATLENTGRNMENQGWLKILVSVRILSGEKTFGNCYFRIQKGMLKIGL